MIFFKMPLEEDGQIVSQQRFSATPTTTSAEGGKQGYAWRADEIGDGDTLKVSYRVRPAFIPPWTESAMDTLARPFFAWPEIAEGEEVAPYLLPPLVREDIAKTEFNTLDPADTTIRDIDRLIGRLDSRIVTVRDVEKFDYTQPLLEDVFHRRTTPRRKHLLLSLALQYLDIPHRVVAGKVISYGEVLENELWVELPVAGRWYRVYYGDGVDRREWMPRENPDIFLACSYDWRDLTLEIVSAAGAPPLPSLLFTDASNLLLKFWDLKNEALLARRYSRALSMMDSVLVFMPQSVTAVTEKGLVLAEAGRPADGLPFLQLGLQLADTPADQSFALVQLAKFHSLQGKGEEAVETLVRAQQIAPFNFAVVYNDHRFRYLAQQPLLMQQLQRALRSIN